MAIFPPSKMGPRRKMTAAVGRVVERSRPTRTAESVYADRLSAELGQLRGKYRLLVKENMLLKKQVTIIRCPKN